MNDDKLIVSLELNGDHLEGEIVGKVSKVGIMALMIDLAQRLNITDYEMFVIAQVYRERKETKK